MNDDLKRIKKLAGILNEETVLKSPPVIQQKEIPLDDPTGWNVVLLNDPVTPFEVVIEALQTVLRITRDEAYRRMMKAHRSGWHVVATYGSEDIAETIRLKLETSCKNNKNYDHYRTMPGVPRYPRGPGGFSGPWPTQFDVMKAGN